MKSSKPLSIALTFLLTSFAASAHATTITYDLIDTPQAGLLDGGFYQYVGGDAGYDSLSFEQNGADVLFTYDSSAGTVSLTGNAYNLNTGEFVNFDLNYSDVTQTGDKLTLNDMISVGEFGTTSVNGKGFKLTLGESLSGSGWLVNDVTAEHFGDFHFSGVKVDTPTGGSVPAPGGLALILIGLAGLGRKLRNTKT
jgi:hypothetical protein